MKRLLGSTFVKAVAIILLAVTAAAALASTLSVVVLNEYGAYTLSGNAVRKKVLDNIGTNRCYNNISWFTSAWDNQLPLEDLGTIYTGDGFCLVVKDEDGKVVLDNLKGQKHQWSSLPIPFSVRSLSYSTVTIDGGEDAAIVVPNQKEGDVKKYTLTGYILKDVPESDTELRIALRLSQIGYAMRYTLLTVLIVCLPIGVLLFIFLMYAAGRRPNDEEVHATYAEKIPFDLYTFIYMVFGIIVIAVAKEFSYADALPILVLGILACCMVGGLLLLKWFMSMSIRIKQRTLIKGCLCYKLCALLWQGIKKLHRFNMELLRSVPLVWKGAAVAGLVLIIEFFWILITSGETDTLFLGWLFKSAVLFALLLYVLVSMKKLLAAGKALAAGQLDHALDTSRLYGPFKEHGDDLNSITDGVVKAVNERTKSEHLRTELITNVSHDIKTPLTSIINYTDLLSKETLENEQAREYVEVLSRQSAKLKKLIEDLIEASKASTGNITVNPERCNLNVLLEQTMGEYREKLTAAELEPVMQLPEDSLYTLADGRLMWRVFDNLLNNICKYSYKGTRVYISLRSENDKAIVCFKNISSQALNISEDELMERFVRGDNSRSSEGNGLGLSIAQSLVKLQKGEMRLSIDGDLFKVELSFDLIN